MNKPLQILLVDDHLLFRKGVEAVLDTRPDMEIVGQGSNGLEAIDLARQTKPDIILMDIAMEKCNGLEATRRIRQEMPDMKIIMVTVSEEDRDLFEAIKAGAQGYVIKDLKVHQLFGVIESVARGEASFSGAIAVKILEEFRRPKEDAVLDGNLVEPLSSREIEVLELIVEGLPNREIADRLFISESTVKGHLRNILDKLHLQNRIQAAVYAVRQGLVGGQPPSH
ncbi:MAG: response regulator transcription factor [Anaerolineales bacterium]|nr:response regulator transcription factor [Anaerolineales bacterium]